MTTTLKQRAIDLECRLEDAFDAGQRELARRLERQIAAVRERMAFGDAGRRLAAILLD